MVKKITILLNSNTEGAGLNRARLLSKGLKENGVDVKWIYLLNNTLKFKILIFFNLILQLIKVAFIKHGKVWVYGHKPWLIFFLIRKKEIIIERTEYPAQLIRNNSKKTENISHYKYASKFITCSNSLIEYYKKVTKKDCKYINIPSVVNFNKFSNCTSSSPLLDKEYIAYCGSMGNNKDGIHDLIKSFSYIYKERDSLYLCLIGTAPKKEMDTIKKLVKKLDIVDKVIFTGNIPHDDMPKYLSNAKLLVLARPNNKQAEGGFPSKLGEYLSTGIPVLITKVGEIPLYIKHNENGFLSEPDNPKMFAKKIIAIIENYNHSKIVAETGQLFVKKKFDYKIQSKLLADFIFN